MRNKILTFLFLIGIPGMSYAQSSGNAQNKRSFSETRETVYLSSFINSRGQNPDGMQDSVSIATVAAQNMNFALKFVFVSSPGTNSSLFMWDRATGTAAGTMDNNFLIDKVKTDTYGFIPYDTETSSGFVYRSSCTACLSPWTAPDLRITGRRVK